MEYVAYTDGACSGNGSKGARGGAAFILVNDNDEIIATGTTTLKNSTNNKAELTAIIIACRYFEGKNEHYEDVLTVYSDSAYCINCYKQEWWKKWVKNDWINSKGLPVLNKELWEILILYFQDEKYNFKKIKGHSGNEFNELVDKMAVQASKAIEEGETIG